MRTRIVDIANFDDLMKSRYAKPDNRLLRGAITADNLLAGYYGVAITTKKTPTKVAAVSLSTHCDDGQAVLMQRNRFATEANGKFAETSGPLPPSYFKSEEKAPFKTPEPLPASPKVAESMPIQTENVAAIPTMRQSASNATVETFIPPAPPHTAPVQNPDASTAKSQSEPSASDDDFVADMKAILEGKGVYDPASGRTRAKQELKEYPREQVSDQKSVAGFQGRMDEPSESQKIFDRIAQSMQYAGAYDLGTVDLENRFTDFDKADDTAKKAAAEKKSQPKPVPRKPDAETRNVGTADFLEDMDAIKKQDQPITARQESVPTKLSVPLYDTGEHVLAGEDLFKGQLIVGRSPGVAFSYGQIISMADLFKSPEQMNAEQPATLNKLKALIDRSTAYYKGKKADKSLDVSNDEWDKATDGRYLKLAEDNYDHFAPNLLYKNEAFARNSSQHGDHRSFWFKYHLQALLAAKAMALNPANARRSYIPVWPLVVNAFGDHYLTDAFSAGHLINKSAVAELFKLQFYSGKSLNAKGKNFFERLAEKSWHGRVSDEFEKLESYDNYAWYTLWWHPDIKNAERFGTVLKGAAEQEPDRIANIAVKAIHDVLNRDGVEVENDVGSGPWHLTGDGYLTPQSLAIMKEAVLKSAQHITDEQVTPNTINTSDLSAKVWAYTPRLTTVSEAKVRGLVTAYVNPDSELLLSAAAVIVEREVDNLVKLLIEKNALRKI
jgi:hypothetical protein